MYRAMALYLLNHGVNGDSQEEIETACSGADISIEYKNGEQIVILNGENVALNGTLWTDKLVEKESHGGLNQYGNYSFGHARGFKYDGKDYVVASSSGWASAYVCIQPADPNEDYLLRSQVFAVATPKSCSAYYYDSETGHGIVLFAAQDYQVVRYDIVREIL